MNKMLQLSRRFHSREMNGDNVLNALSCVLLPLISRHTVFRFLSFISYNKKGATNYECKYKHIGDGLRKIEEKKKTTLF